MCFFLNYLRRLEKISPFLRPANLSSVFCLLAHAVRPESFNTVARAHLCCHGKLMRLSRHRVDSPLSGTFLRACFIEMITMLRLVFSDLAVAPDLFHGSTNKTCTSVFPPGGRSKCLKQPHSFANNFSPPPTNPFLQMTKSTTALRL